MEGYIDVVSYLNDGKIEEAGKKMVEIGKEVEDEDVRNVIAEIEREMMEVRHEREAGLSYSPYYDQLLQATRSLERCRIERMKYLILHGLYLLTKGNTIIMDMVRQAQPVKPRTYL